MPLLFKILQVLALSSVKFAFAAPYSIELGFNYYETVILLTVGGTGGVIFFFYLSTGILNAYDWVLHRIKHSLSRKYRARPKKHKKPRKVFSKRNRFLVRLRGRYGMIGIALLTPILLSIPVGTFIANKYYKNKGVLWYMFISIAVWSGILSTIYFFW